MALNGEPLQVKSKTTKLNQIYRPHKWPGQSIIISNNFKKININRKLTVRETGSVFKS